MKITRCKQQPPADAFAAISQLYAELSRNALQKGECATVEGFDDIVAIGMALNSLFLTPIRQDGKIYLYRTHDLRTLDTQRLADKSEQVEAWLGYNPYSMPWVYNPTTRHLERKEKPAAGEYEVSFTQAAQFMLGQIEEPVESKSGDMRLYIGVGGVVWGFKDGEVRQFDMAVPDDWERVHYGVYLAYLLSEDL